MKKKLLPAIFLIVSALMLTALSCGSSKRKRPYGYMRLGSLSKFLAAETFLEDKGIFIRRDENGFYAMSTYCTYDLSHLVLKKDEKGRRFESSFTNSTYDLNGKVLTGPAKENLPYFEVKMAAKSTDSPIPTLYVKISTEVSPSWRLDIPEVEAQ